MLVTLLVIVNHNNNNNSRVPLKAVGISLTIRVLQRVLCYKGNDTSNWV